MWLRRFANAVKQRDAFPEGSPEHAHAQERVSYCFERMYRRGFYGDRYGPLCLLSLFGLSWLKDVAALCDEEGLLQPEGARVFLKMLRRRELYFAYRLWGAEPIAQVFYRGEYRLLRGFLEHAIGLREPILCDL